MKFSLTIGHLYGLQMNTYGDNGNIITLKKRCEWRGIDVAIKYITYVDEIKEGDYDLYFFGGGQDQTQALISRDLTGGFKDQVKKDVEKGVPLLSICGGYQLLGAYYQPQKGPKIGGLGIFPIYTTASSERMIGNLVIDLVSDGLEMIGKLVGFENHSGKTYLTEGGKPLGKVVKGFGNNGEDGTEGCVYKNAIGCYMHGSLLPKNPQLADWLIKRALEVKYGKKIELEPLNDGLENQAHEGIIKRFVD